MRINKYKIIFSILFLISSPLVVSGQCAMCRAALRTNEDQSVASGINHGITYLMVFPYVLVALLGFAIYRVLKKENSTK